LEKNWDSFINDNGNPSKPIKSFSRIPQKKQIASLIQDSGPGLAKKVPQTLPFSVVLLGSWEFARLDLHYFLRMKKTRHSNLTLREVEVGCFFNPS